MSQIQKLITYIVVNNPEGARNLIREKGYVKPLTTSQGLYNGLVYLYKSDKHQALMDFARIHPDRELVIDVNCPDVQPKGGRALANADGSGERQSCCGCSAADGYSNCCSANGVSNCEGNKQCKKCAMSSNAEGVVITGKDWLTDNFPTLIVGGVLGVAIFLIVRGQK